MECFIDPHLSVCLFCNIVPDFFRIINYDRFLYFYTFSVYLCLLCRTTSSKIVSLFDIPSTPETQLGKSLLKLWKNFKVQSCHEGFTTIYWFKKLEFKTKPLLIYGNKLDWAEPHLRSTFGLSFKTLLYTLEGSSISRKSKMAAKNKYDWQ